MAGMREQQKERFSRAFVVAAAASACEDFTYTILPDDIEGVDMVVRHRGIAVDFQLKATARPYERNGCLLFDLDVPTYRALAKPLRSGLGVLALVVLHPQPAQWVTMSDDLTLMTHCAYYLVLTGADPTANDATVRLSIPLKNRLTPHAMRELMVEARARLMT